MAKKKRKKDELLFDIAEAAHGAETFYERNEKLILGGIIGVIALVVGFLAYQNMYKIPREKEASAELYFAEKQFERDSFETALINPGGGHLGLVDIASDYSGTPAANLANYYAGISYMKLGKYDAAIAYLEDFNAAGEIFPIMKHGVMGDAYSELENFDKAIAQYKKAVDVGHNTFVTPYYMKKLGMLYERQGDADKALAIYKKIKADFRQSQEGHTIDKYVARAEVDY